MYVYYIYTHAYIYIYIYIYGMHLLKVGVPQRIFHLVPAFFARLEQSLERGDDNDDDNNHTQ